MTRPVPGCILRGMAAKTKRVGVTLPGDLLLKIDLERGDVPRSLWIQRAVEERLVALRDVFKSLDKGKK